ncbi:42754_t:CDS:2, partial [Gigaspora margarita]
STNSYFIILGDFNYIPDTDLNKSSQSELQYNKKFPLHKWIQRQDFFDSYRLANSNFFEDAYILYMDVCTGSKHNLAVASFNIHGQISKITLVKMSLLTQTAINKIWESFEDGIIFATKRNIPFKIIKGSQPDYKVKHKSKEKKRRSILYTKSNQIILEVNTKLDIQIQALSNTINKEWLDDLKGW